MCVFSGKPDCLASPSSLSGLQGVYVERLPQRSDNTIKEAVREVLKRHGRIVEVVIDGDTHTLNENEFDNHMVYEMKAFNDMFSRQAYDECYKNLEHSLSVMKILTDARNKAGIIFS